MESSAEGLKSRVDALEVRVARLQWGSILLLVLVMVLSGSLSLLGMSYSAHLTADRPGVKRAGD